MKIRPRLWNRTDPERPRRCRSIMRGSSLGNPFVIGVDGTREEVIAKYEELIRRSVDRLLLIANMDDEDLVCCCAPMPCHGDVILKIWDELNAPPPPGQKWKCVGKIMWPMGSERFN